MRYSLVIFSYAGTYRDWAFVFPVHKRVISIKKNDNQFMTYGEKL